MTPSVPQVSEPAQQVVPTWVKPLLATSWRTAGDDTNSTSRMQFDRHRYVIVNAQDEIEDQGKLVFHPTERRIGLFNSKAGGWLTVEEIQPERIKVGRTPAAHPLSRRAGGL